MAAESKNFETFKTIFEAGSRAWNEHDFKTAYGALPDDFVHVLGSAWPESREPMHGPDEVIAFFDGLCEMFPDIQTGPTTYIEVDDRRVITGFEVFGTGRQSGTKTKMEIWALWEFGADMRPIRCVEYVDRPAAMKAAGITEQAKQGAR